MAVDRKVVIGGVVGVALAFVIGLGIGYAGKGSAEPPTMVVDSESLVGHLVADKFSSDVGMVEQVMDSVRGSSLRDYLEVRKGNNRRDTKNLIHSPTVMIQSL